MRTTTPVDGSVAPGFERVADAFAANFAEHGEVADAFAAKATWWPEFAQAGKGDIPLRWVLSHEAGLAAVTGEVTMDDVLGWEGVVDGVRLLAPGMVARATRVQVSGPDHVIGLPMSFGLGHMTPPSAGGDVASGHDGAGGSLGMADPAGEWSFGYVMNQMKLGLTGDARSADLVAAVREAVAAS